jgi:hypothetical protein
VSPTDTSKAKVGTPAPENILTAVLPEVFGNMDAAPYWGRGTLTEMSLFMGVAPFVLMIAGIVHGERRAKRFALVMTLVVLVLAWGDYTPLFHVLYDHVPGFGSFRGTTKFIFLAALFMAMLAAVGSTCCDERPRGGLASRVSGRRRCSGSGRRR